MSPCRVTNQTRSTALEWAITAVRGRLTPAVLTSAELREFAGTYGAHAFVLVAEHLEYRGAGATYRLIPIGGDTFLIDGVYAERFRFSRDDLGRVISVATLTQEGAGRANEKAGGNSSEREP